MGSTAAFIAADAQVSTVVALLSDRLIDEEVLSVRQESIHGSIVLTLSCFSKTFVNKFNQDYEEKHLAFETQFWGTKMALADREEVKFSAENLSKTKTEM